MTNKPTFERTDRAWIRLQPSFLNYHSLEWNSPLFVNFIDYKKALDSVDRESL
ncbi:hypothetical protein DPMN_095018 [Dreissena polymorpha]|uniref:Uncharacterized protein n=1 Tax=Dreissena polymorpha TaxID=45954 RepID=A0A9D4R361_DREPO|nr:hypothetical protein DPMN_095018 [Dreissena polymorpha]